MPIFETVKTAVLAVAICAGLALPGTGQKTDEARTGITAPARFGVDMARGAAMIPAIAPEPGNGSGA